MERISEEKMKEALTRSGYLLESRVLDFFSNNNYWAESSHRFFENKEDGKYRELDVLANKTLDWINVKNNEESLAFNVHFITECINNPVPLALFENKGDLEEPTTDWAFDFINGSPELKEISSIHWIHAIHAFESQIIKELPSRQYCGFVKKKSKDDEWMASHPEDFHNTLLKLVQFVKYKRIAINENWEGRQPTMCRLELLIPLIVLQGEMIEIKTTENLEVNPINYYRLKVPYESSYNKSISIDIVTESYLPEFLKRKNKGFELMFNYLKENLDNDYV